MRFKTVSDTTDPYELDPVCEGWDSYSSDEESVSSDGDKEQGSDSKVFVCFCAQIPVEGESNFHPCCQSVKGWKDKNQSEEFVLCLTELSRVCDAYHD